ncbi:FAD-dependent tricarballylate dehydrogenase TcuA [Amycolatopsis sp. GM8]|uniref:FAD-dependent tricarballylate dehydrogenase TcuA n=1 Tax=Amycolatopsis sp. GM8 TaxID=2896530 RepID=UPI001F1CE7F0|nr:FAD-dependent tricarballylate dehydrogenase TcuA [Amycolatopsis sp. GM8]
MSAASLDTVVVIGSGVAGLSAAVSAAEEGAHVVVVDRAGSLDAGGNSKWTSAYLRLEDVYEAGESFVDDLREFSGGRTPDWYGKTLVELLPETMEWIQGHGARFRKFPTYFINSNRPRLQPVGGGEGLLIHLRAAAEKLGVEFRYETTAERLEVGNGRVTGVVVSDTEGTHTIPASATVIASGGFEGDETVLGKELGGDVSTLIPIAPGVPFNKGEGIRMALEIGAKRGGQWDSFHAEPVDPRSGQPEALVMVFPYGILVNKHAERFLDEGRGTVDETYERTAREVWAQPGGTAYFVTDRKFEQVTDRERGLLTSAKPVSAGNLDELAAALDLPAEKLAATVTTFNESVVDGPFDWRVPDGKHTDGLTPPKTNWALRVDEPPFLAYPVACAIVFTFGGLETDAAARVVDEQDTPIPGLYAAGECTGIYHDKYPGGTSVLRGIVFGRVAGRAAGRG